MYFWLFASVFVACEQVPPVGDPMQPVVVDAVEIEEDSVDAEEVDAEEEEVFSISSEELAPITAGDDLEDKSLEAAQTPETQEKTAVAEASPTQAKAEPAVAAAPAVPASSGWGDVIGKAWPVRLVTPVPNATPPRAILGLPDGREVVVNPGSMVPDMGLVVVAIAPNSAELARIAPAGDHATIETMTLRAQY